MKSARTKRYGGDTSPMSSLGARLSRTFSSRDVTRESIGGESFKKARGFFATFKLSKKSGLSADMSAETAFRILDKDGSGSITSDQFKVALIKGKSSLTDSELIDIIEMVDQNDDGELQLAEFEKVWRHFTTTAKEATEATKSKFSTLFSSLLGKRTTPLRRSMSAGEAFTIFDADGNGELSVEELKEVLMMGTGSILSNDEIEAIIAEVRDRMHDRIRPCACFHVTCATRLR